MIPLSSPFPDKRQRGAVLLLSVLLLASVTAIATGLSVLIVNDIRSNKAIDQGVQAYYQAESGLEGSLDTIRQYRNSGQCSTVIQPCSIDADCPSGTCVSKTLADTLTAAPNPIAGVSARLSAAAVSKLAFSQLPKDQSVRLNVYDPDHFLDDALQIRKLIITGTTTNNAWLEVSWTGWLDDGNGTFFDRVTQRLVSACGFDPAQFGACGVSGPQEINLRDAHTLMVAFQVTIKSILGDVSNLQVRVLNNSGVDVSPPSHILVKSQGSVGPARTALTAVVPWRLPASGLFDFVLFSEETIKKETT